MNSAHIGSISEGAVELDLLRRGYNVLSPAVVARYDRLVEADDRYIRVQIKTARLDTRDGNLRVSYDTPYSPFEVDVIAVFNPKSAEIYYIPIDIIPPKAKGFTLRLTERIYKRKKAAGLDADQYKTFPPQQQEDN